MSSGKKLDEAKNIEAPSDRVKEVTLFEKFDLQYSYKDLPQELETYPRLKLEVASRNTGTAAKPKCFALNIYKIIITNYMFSTYYSSYGYFNTNRRLSK